MIKPDHAAKSMEQVKEYYGKVLQTHQDLKTSACCTSDSMPPYLRDIEREIHADVLARFFGCGSPIPPELSGKTVLDLGSGSGRDCYLLSKLVGPEGSVIGVDMTEQQIAVAKKYQDYHAQVFGYQRSNVTFHYGYIEDLESLGIANGSVDVVVSNCVINLSPHKERVFSEIFRVLKPGGELYFSDVFASRRVPQELVQDPVLLGECLAGAMYTEDFRRMMAKVGCLDVRVVATSQIALSDPDIEKKIGMIDFTSQTIRAFHLPLEDRCENYGQVAYYLGTIPEFPHAFLLDDHHLFKKNEPMLVCGNTAAMLSQTRFARHFRVVGDTSVHFGLFDCGPSPSPDILGGSCC